VSSWEIGLFGGQRRPSPLSNLSRAHQWQQSGNVDAHRDDAKRFVVGADERFDCFCGTRISDSTRQNPRGVRSAWNKAGQIAAALVKASSISSSDSFNLSQAGLTTPGLDFR